MHEADMWKYVDDTTIAEAVDNRQEVVLSKWKTISQGKKGMKNFKLAAEGMSQNLSLSVLTLKP